MSRELIKAQRVDIEFDELYFNGVATGSIPIDESTAVTLSFSGGVGATPINKECNLYRVGGVVFMTIPTSVYNGNQAVGLITVSTIPAGYRPTFTRAVTGFTVINGSLSGGTASNATQMGAALVGPNGEFTIGLGFDNDSILVPFGGAGTTGSGNGITASQIFWTI